MTRDLQRRVEAVPANDIRGNLVSCGVACRRTSAPQRGRCRVGKGRVAKDRPGKLLTAHRSSQTDPIEVWAVDFQFDVTTDARPLKIVSTLMITGEYLGDVVERNLTGKELINELE